MPTSRKPTLRSMARLPRFSTNTREMSFSRPASLAASISACIASVPAPRPRLVAVDIDGELGVLRVAGAWPVRRRAGPGDHLAVGFDHDDRVAGVEPAPDGVHRPGLGLEGRDAVMDALVIDVGDPRRVLNCGVARGQRPARFAHAWPRIRPSTSSTFSCSTRWSSASTFRRSRGWVFEARRLNHQSSNPTVSPSR